MCPPQLLNLDEERYSSNSQMYLGDYNSLNISWMADPSGQVKDVGSEMSWARGKSLGSQIDTGACLLLVNDQDTGPTTTHGSVIDLCFASTDLYPKLHMEVLDDVSDVNYAQII